MFLPDADPTDVPGVGQSDHTTRTVGKGNRSPRYSSPKISLDVAIVRVGNHVVKSRQGRHLISHK